MPGFQHIFEGYGADYRTTMYRFINNEETLLRLPDMLFQEDSLEKPGSAFWRMSRDGHLVSLNTQGRRRQCGPGSILLYPGSKSSEPGKAVRITRRCKRRSWENFKKRKLSGLS